MTRTGQDCAANRPDCLRHDIFEFGGDDLRLRISRNVGVGLYAKLVELLRSRCSVVFQFVDKLLQLVPIARLLVDLAIQVGQYLGLRLDGD